MNRSKFRPHVSVLAALAAGAPDTSVSEMPADPNVCHQYDDEDEDYEDVEGSVMGDTRMAVVGYSDDGVPLVVRGAARGARVRVRKPNWRKRQLAPGVIAPDEGMLPLPLTGSGGTNTFSTANPTGITFQGQLQKPFRGERLLVSTVRTGTSAVGRLLGQLFVGTDLQQLDIQGFDLEQVGTPTAFGVRLTMKPAQPGVFIRVVTTLTTALAGTDTIVATVTLLGRLIH